MADYSAFAPSTPSFAALAGLSPEEEAALEQAARGDPNTGKHYGLGGRALAGHQRQMEALSNYMGMLSGTNQMKMALAGRSMQSNEQIARLGAQGRAASALKDVGLLNDIGGGDNILPDMTPDDANTQRTLALRANTAKNVGELGAGAHNLAAGGYYPKTDDLASALDLGLDRGTPLAVMTAAQRAKNGGGSKTNYTTIQQGDPNDPSRVVTRRIYDGTGSPGPVFGAGGTIAPTAAGHQQAQTNEGGLPGDISGLDDTQYSQALEVQKALNGKGEITDVQMDSNGDAHLILKGKNGVMQEYVIPKDTPDAGVDDGNAEDQ